MKNNWSKEIAKKYIKKYEKLGFSADLALRVYTTRLLGRNKELVLHGGGNTSVKTTIKDIDGKKYKVLCVKGSGWDMADIEPPGLPAVKLEPLLTMKKKKYLSDEDMVNFQKKNLISSVSSKSVTAARLLRSGCLLRWKSPIQTSCLPNFTMPMRGFTATPTKISKLKLLILD